LTQIDADDILGEITEETIDGVYHSPIIEEVEEVEQPNNYLNDILSSISAWDKDQIEFGPIFPSDATEGDYFLKTNTMPTELFQYEDEHWEVKNKDDLPMQAYSNNYIRVLIDKLSNNQYNPVLLSENERNLIERILKEDSNAK
jgi:hypothetical protein